MSSSIFSLCHFAVLPASQQLAFSIHLSSPSQHLRSTSFLLNLRLLLHLSSRVCLSISSNSRSALSIITTTNTLVSSAALTSTLASINLRRSISSSKLAQPALRLGDPVSMLLTRGGDVVFDGRAAGQCEGAATADSAAIAIGTGGTGGTICTRMQHGSVGACAALSQSSIGTHGSIVSISFVGRGSCGLRRCRVCGVYLFVAGDDVDASFFLADYVGVAKDVLHDLLDCLRVIGLGGGCRGSGEGVLNAVLGGAIGGRGVDGKAFDFVEKGDGLCGRGDPGGCAG